MRTTLNIDDALYRQAKARAALGGRSMTSFVEEALRRALAEDEVGAVVRALPVSTRAGGLTEEFVASGVDVDDTSAVRDYLDEVDR